MISDVLVINVSFPFPFLSGYFAVLISYAQKKNLFSKNIIFWNKSKGEETCDRDLKKDAKFLLEDDSN